MRNLRLVFFESKLNRYSVNTLLGAIETYEELECLPIYFVQSAEEAVSLINSFPKTALTVLNFSFFTPQLWDVEKAVKKIKKEVKRELILTAGDPHPSGDPIGTFNMGFDRIFVGEGEVFFPSFLVSLMENKEYQVSSNVCVNLNAFPPFSVRFRRFNPIEITRGCPFGCAFCQTPRIFGRRVRHRSVDVIVSHVETMVKHGLKDIRFVTPNALFYGSENGVKLNLKAVEALLSSVKKVKGVRKVFFGSFPSEVRPEHVTEESIELIKQYADNDNLVIGAQSGSDRILKLCNRSHTVEDVYKAVEITVKRGFKAKVDFIFGFPDETKEDVKQTIGFMEELTKLGAVIHAHFLMPLPQTPFVREKPKPLDKRVLRLINKLTGKGLLFGNWREQEHLAMKIYDYFRRQFDNISITSLGGEIF